MKKTLAILLSLALVICMIPATAFAARAELTRTIGGKEYKISISENVFTYNNTVQTPVVEVKNADGTEVTDHVEVTYALSSAPGTAVQPKDAGVYNVDVKITPTEGAPSTDTVATFTINKIDLSDAGLKIVNTQEITSSVITDGATTPTNYFQVKYGSIVLNSDDYAMTGQPVDTTGIKISVAAGKNTEGTAKEETFYIVQSLADGYTIAAAEGDFVYTGSKMDPTLVVKKNGGSQLAKGTDYTVSCTNNVNAGETVTVTVTGKGNYKDSLTQDFTIAKKSISDATIDPATPVVAQYASTVDFSVKVGGRTLTRGTDYTLGTFSTSTVSDNAKVTISGMGNYEGSKEVTFRVIGAGSKDLTAATLTMDRTQLTYNGSAQAPTETVKIGADKISSSAYTIKYKLHGSSATATTTRPTDCGTYDVLIENKTGYSGSKTFESAFEIKPLDINSSSITATYTGTYGNPVTLKLNSYTTLRQNYDYYVDSYASSRGYYIVTGRGNFTGTRYVYMTTRNLSSCTVNFTDNRSSVAYGSTYYPKVTAYYGSTKLYENTDYTLTYKNSKNQTVSYCRDTGTYTVIVTGTGAYTGTKTLYFTITGTDISNYTVTLKESSVTATGYSQTPVITSVKYGYYSSLSSNDYTVSYQDATGKTVYSMSAPGTYRVVVTGKNGYSGTTYATFRIVGLPQTVTVTQDSYKVYDDSDVFKITAKATGDGTGFTYTSSNPSVASVSSTGYVTPNKVGRAVITVTTTGNKKYEPTSKQVVVKVYPDKAKLSKKPWTDGKASQLKVRWGYQDGVTKYQVRYSRDKNFSSGSYLTKTVKAHGKSYTTQSTTLSNLKRGYTYYVKVRAVYTDPVTGDNYYGSWSGWRSAKTI